MDNITAPSRMTFIKSEKPSGCVFCKDSIRDESLVLSDDGIVSFVMNKYPYNPGHVLIIPDRHVATLEELTAEERLKIMNGMDIVVRIIQEAMNPHAFNLGLNLGQAAGAGIIEHLHVHVVPRWSGDTNFMTCLAETRVTPENVTETCAELKPLFEKMLKERAA